MELETYLAKLKGFPRKSSADCLELMHQALEMGDKKWFQESAKEKERLEILEKEMKEELGISVVD